MKCLLIAPKFYEYYKDISTSLNNNGYSVSFESDQAGTSTFDFIKRKIIKNYKLIKTNEYVNSILKKYNNEFDLIIIILAYDFTKENIENLIKKFNKAKFIYYTWDSVSNFPNIQGFLPLFDKCFSFDDLDCKKYGMTFLPLFYPKNVSKNNNSKIYDYCSIMSFYPTKSEGYNKIKNVLPSGLRKYEYFRLKSKIFYFYFRIKYKKLMKNYRMKHFKFKSLSKKETYDVYSKSKVVLDIPLKNQNGLTIRTFEALKSGCKLITTNINIKKYDFYSPDNIFIVDENTQKIPVDFFNSEFNLSYSISNKYSVESFVNCLLNIKKETYFENKKEIL